MIRVQAIYLKGSYVIREPEVGMICRLGVVGLENEVSRQSIPRSVAYRIRIIGQHGIKHHRVCVQLRLWG